MTSDLDIYRAALDYLEQHGDAAPIFAATEADRLLEDGDLDGAATWRQVVNVIHEMMESGVVVQ